MEDLLTIKNLAVNIQLEQGEGYAVNGFDLKLQTGRTYALLGESGCGKSMTALAILGLLPPAATTTSESNITLAEQDLLALPEVAMRRIRGRRIATVFQEPMTALNPVLTVGEQIGEVLQHHFKLQGQAQKARVLELLTAVGMPEVERQFAAYPHQLSGGMKQRVIIAMALAGEPDILIADEPTTALDVTIQAQILKLLKQLQSKTQMTILLITHDLGVVREVADEVAVMYAGHIVEQAPVKAFFAKPRHPYSQKLFDSLPSLQKRQQVLQVIKGTVPPLGDPLPACRFAERCPWAWQVCHDTPPRWLAGVRCHLYDDNFKATRPLAQAAEATTSEPMGLLNTNHELLLTVKNLKVYFPIRKGVFKRIVGHVKAVDGIDLQLAKGRTLAIVGESGSGKTTAGKAILQLLRPTAGEVHYAKQALNQLSHRQLHAVRREIQIIFQDPYAAMNPRMMVGDIIAEGLLAHRASSRKIRRQISLLLEQVGLPESAKQRYPHEFSGGQRQRICIARALALQPKIIICDEPTSALDVSVQAQILNLLKRLQNETGIAYLFITHNIAAVSYLADDVAVMTHGKIVEQAPVAKILHDPEHEYTKSLLAAVPEVYS